MGLIVEISDLIAALRTNWRLALAGAVAGLLAAAVFVLVSPPAYSSRIQLFVSATDSSSTSDAYQGNQLSQQRAGSYARLLEGRSLAARVVERLELPLTPEQLVKKVSAAAVADTVLLEVTVTDASASGAQRIAATIGDEFIDVVRELETPQAGGPSPVKVTVTEEPELAKAPTSPRPLRDVALGALAGCLLGAALGVLRARLDRTVKDAEDANALTGAPVIGVVLRDEALASRHVAEPGRDMSAAEDYRQLRANLQFLKVDEPPRVIMVSSALPSEGKTTLAINLGLALADAGQRVVIVEADLRRPKVTAYLGMVAGVGVTNVLSGSADLQDVVQTYREGVHVLAAGPTPPNPSELLASSHMEMLIDKLRVDYDFVLVDAPPLLPVADATGLAPATDGVLMSVRYGSTRKDQLQQAAVTLDRVGAGILGLVLNIVPAKAEIAAAYGRGQDYSYA
jgi:capsular exopolysaccharide synthesis family protein